MNQQQNENYETVNVESSPYVAVGDRRGNISASKRRLSKIPSHRGIGQRTIDLSQTADS